MNTKIDPIRNKYDVHGVEKAFNQFFTDLMIDESKAVELKTIENIKLVLGSIISVFILLSYFHKIPFPKDKPLIVGCMIMYGILSVIIYFFTTFRVGNIFCELRVDPKNLPKELKTKVKENLTLKFSS